MEDAIIGEVLSTRYRILRKIGEGATGKVYLARNISAARDEAIKVLRPAVAVDQNFVSRFRREARATNRAQHANIVSVYDFGRLPDGRLFLATEYAEGPRLDQVVEDSGPLPVARVLHIAGQLALALDHAHSRGVIHRDLKPSNVILIEHRGQKDVVKVLDFGMAKIIAPEYKESLAVTANGEVFGTPAYMAPEQFRGTGDDPRIDIYSVGCVLYELLTGDPPFMGQNMELMVAHTQRLPEPPSERRPGAGIPPELDEVVLGCLAKEPEQRLRSGDAIYRALQGVPGFQPRRTGVGPATTARGLSIGTATAGRGLPVGGAATAEGIAVTAPHDYGKLTDESTASTGVEDRVGLALELADTGSISHQEIEQAKQHAILDLAEALLDHGAKNSKVTVSVARLHALADDVLRTEIEQTALMAQEEKVEQATREREASLRFAIGELQFDRDQAGEALRAELDRQLQDLEDRLRALRAQTRRQLNAITEKGIALAAERGALQDRCAHAFGELEHLLERVIPQYEQDLEIAPLLDRYRAIQQML
jgi:tRNA A-37 threonylcarbamoyl transferase component Bud32